MKRFICVLCMVLVMTIGYAQRPSSGSSRGSVSTSRSSSVSTSRSSSMSSSRSTATYTPSRSSSSYSSSRSVSTPTHSRSTVSSTPSRSSNYSRSNVNTPRTATNYSRSNVNSGPRSTMAPRAFNRPSNAPSTGRKFVPAHDPHHTPRGMHPQPPMYHPHHHHHIHMHHCCIDHWYLHDCCWVGYWGYVHCHPYHEVVIYTRDAYAGVEVLSLATDEFYIYILMRDHRAGQTYFQVSDNMDRVILKVPVHRKYQTVETDSDGVWIFKNNGKDLIYFMRMGDQFFMYES